MLKNKVFDIVIATRFLNGDNSVFEQLLSWKRLKSDEERELIENIKPYVELCQLNDGRYPEELFLVGVDTDGCVLATAIDLFENNIRPIVLTDYCASNGGEEVHTAAITCMKRLIGTRQIKEGNITERTQLQ